MEGGCQLIGAGESTSARGVDRELQTLAWTWRSCNGKGMIKLLAVHRRYKRAGPSTVGNVGESWYPVAAASKYPLRAWPALPLKNGDQGQSRADDYSEW